jgi:beta-xylosidase
MKTNTTFTTAEIDYLVDVLQDLIEVEDDDTISKLVDFLNNLVTDE